MASCSCLSLPELSKQQLLDLFSTSEAQKHQWCRVIPNNKDSLKCTPSASDKYYRVIAGCDEVVKTKLRKSFEKVFIEHGHVETFWEDFALNVTHKLRLTYREVQKINGMYSEAKLQQSILNPILKEVSGATCIIPGTKIETLRSDFLIEDEIELQAGRKGQKPTVDAVIQFSNENGKVRMSIPIEMKIDLDTKHYSQIACYMNKLSTAEDIRGCIMVGILIDKKQFRLAFSVFCSGTVPLPIVHISPPVQWRSESKGIISEESMLTLACTFLIGQLERIEFDPKKHLQDIKVAPESLIGMGELLLQTPHTFLKPKRESIVSLSKKQEEQQKEIEELKERVKELEGSGADKPRCKRPKTESD